MLPILRGPAVLCQIAKADKRPNRGLHPDTKTESTLEIQGTEIIKVQIIGIVVEITTTRNLPPAEIIAGIQDVIIVATDILTAEIIVPTAGIDITIAVTDITTAGKIGILTTITEAGARRTVI
jgi:hypothetical protein